MKNKIIVALFIAMSLLLVNVHAAIEENSTINMTKDSHFGNIILTIPSGFEKVEPGKSLLTKSSDPKYYTTYDVRVSGQSGRGTHRIVTGKQGERYYTSDHYKSFRRVRGRSG